MVEKALKTVLQAEEEANLLLTDAKRRAVEIEEEAKRRAAARVETIRSDAEKKAQHIREEAAAGAEREMEPQRKEAEKTVHELQKQTADVMKQASSRIVKEVFDYVGRPDVQI